MPSYFSWDKYERGDHAWERNYQRGSRKDYYF
jgi:hypothetical protein